MVRTVANPSQAVGDTSKSPGGKSRGAVQPAAACCSSSISHLLEIKEKRGPQYGYRNSKGPHSFKNDAYDQRSSRIQQHRNK